MLRQDLELVVQYPDGSGYKCRGFRGLRLASAAYVVFDGAAVSDQSAANVLGAAFCRETLRYTGVTEEAMMPCHGARSDVVCHAMAEPTCRKILVRLAATPAMPQAGNWAVPSAEGQWLSMWPQPDWEVIPVLPEGASIAAYVPSPWRGINACFWSQNPGEALWAVMQRAGLTPEESRVFISYVRRDTTAIADQLFEALTQEGFDVFLDRCSVPVGVQFQERLMQDLCDKAMVVLLNSDGVANSRWVEEEITIIKTYRLGLLELRFPGGKDRPDIDSDFSQPIHRNDLSPAGTGYAPGASILSDPTLKKIVVRIKDVHGRALHRRRYELIDNFAAALMATGKNPQMMADGTFLIPASGTNAETVVSLTARPPELCDFCSLHQRGGVSASRVGWLVSPAPLFLAQRQNDVAWLSGVSNIQHANEAQINQLAAAL